MASAILFGLIESIIEYLGFLIFQEIGSLWGISDDLEKLKNIVSILQAVLLDASEQQNQNHQVREWLERLEDAVYDANDFLNELPTEAPRSSARSGNNVINKVLCLACPVNFKMSRKIKKTRKILNAIAEDRTRFHFVERSIESHVVSRKRKPTYSFVSEEEVIGRDDEKNAIIELLLDLTVEENVSVIPIVGMAGIGKTTLAQSVYNSDKVKEHFELKMWVCVSDHFELEIIAKKIITSATENTPPNLELEQIQILLRREINHQKYLLVLDDVWNENREEWFNLKKLLNGGSKGSKILITTQSRRVAQITSTGSPYLLKCLSDNLSWLLFKQVAFSKEQIANDQLVSIGREIVGICQGLPLAIKSIGHVLHGKETELEWLHVKNDLLADETIKENPVQSILKLSYDYLPSYLKCCFSYCSLFPKNYEMDKETIKHLWIAQGFIQSRNKNQQSEDIAEECFKDLFWRSFFEEVKDSYGVTKYKMHYLIHNLAKSVAGAKCKLVDLNGENIDMKIRHVSCPFSMQSSFIETLRLLAKADKIRTFLLTFGEYCSGSIDESMLDKLILSFKSLRALDLHGLEIKTVPNSIKRLTNLRYLDLSWNKSIKILPDFITTLRNLQTLKLNSCENLKELPKDIKELVSLKHLDNGGCYGLSHMPSGLGQMTCIQTLQLFVVSKDPPISRHIGGLKELKLLNNLRGTIEIAHLERLTNANLESKVANLREKWLLEKLVLGWDAANNLDVNNDEMSLDGLEPNRSLKSLIVKGYGGVSFPIWLSSLTNLTNLMLHTCNRCQNLPQLSQLSSLKHLSLEDMSDLEYISDGDTTEVLASLKSLRITNCPTLKRWWRDFVEEVNNRNGNVVATTSTLTVDHQHQQHQHCPLMLPPPSFPCLSSLSIYNCPYLTFMPLFPCLEESLILNDVNIKPLQQTMAMASSLPSSSSSRMSYPLSKLKSMCLLNIWDVIYFPNEWALNLTSLKHLEIWDCARLRSLSRAIQYITSLEELWIVNCEEFDPLSDMDDDGMEWRRLNFLQSLTFERLPKLESLPAGLQHISILEKLVISNCPNLMTLPRWIKELTSLERLEIDGFSNLTSLPDEISWLRSLRWLTIAGFTNLMAFPEWINNLSSLEQLQILRCPKLTALPNGMRCLKSLQMLIIMGCPHLEQNCEEDFGVDWSKISHVPIVSFSNQPGISDNSISVLI